MVSAGAVRGDSDAVVQGLSNYESAIGELKGNWEGSSYNNFSTITNEFKNEFEASIKEGMESFAKACELYEEYEKKKKALEDLEKKIDEKVEKKRNTSRMITNDNGRGKRTNPAYRKLQREITKLGEDKEDLNKELEKLKKEIKENLDAAASIKLEATGYAAKTSSGSGKNQTIAAPPQLVIHSLNLLGADEGELNNARLGEEGRPDPNNNKFFQSEANGGINGFPLNGGGPGVGGNCTYYAYSRFSELLGKEATGLADGDACSWYDKTKGYKKGSTPKLGAIAVWQYGNSGANGHVAVVEKIDKDGTIHTSEGGWSNKCWYKNGTYKKSNNYATGWSDGHLLGFIYPEEE